MEEKIKINISKEVNDILLKDMELFEFYKKDNTLNKNDFINTLIMNYHETYQKKCNELYNHIVSKLNEEFISNSISSIAHSLVHSIESNNYHSSNSKFDVPVSIKPTKRSSKIINYIQQCHLEGTSLSNYFRNLFASYTSLPKDKRELIIFKEQYESIQDAIQRKCKIYFTTKKNPDKHIASPYALSSSKEELFNYVLVEYKNRPFSFRLSRMNQVVVLNEEAIIDKNCLNFLEKMKRNGPQFAYEKESEICVRLIGRGKEMYKRMYLHRPTPIRIEDDCYYFDCSKNQIIQYFYRFGRYAYIESPKELAEEMLNRYQSAARAYRRNIKGDNDENM